jgi:uncharacterized repeat protein (TIGR03803 family)
LQRFSFFALADFRRASFIVRPLSKGIVMSSLSRLFTIKTVGAIALGILLVPMSAASAKMKFKVVYSFCVDGTCSDGQNPNSTPVGDDKGNVYGTVGAGGAQGSGGVYKVQPNGTETLLYSFCSLSVCTDGSNPGGGLILDTKGNLYGTTIFGGTGHQGIVYKLSRAKQTPWKLTVLYNFCSRKNCTDGSQPFSGLTYVGKEAGALYDGVSSLYGTTTAGGNADKGVAYRLAAQPGKKKLKYDAIYGFCAQAGCSDGAVSYEPLTTDMSGNLYGVTVNGGNGDNGVAFELSANGSRGFGETVLYVFCQLADCADGSQPVGITADDASGDLFGVTGGGGTGGGAGTVFKLVPNGTSSQETVLHSFCTVSGCLDGGYPSDGVTVGANGDLYGVTALGGTSFENGAVFKLHGTTETVIHNFCEQSECPDGSEPIGNVILDGAGSVYGVAVTGGASGLGGTLYKITKP